ncbi:hypothetical protein [Hymenobacter sp. GOD-10R]|uniref:hypothetical protein n=1 Tax=Hymenobacter sp. GOD-10R TaxID=3093922 RepID=UPI002D777E38|nr:hypothetical protein [Hymenobacter sp. GOD-10R]WRQ30363.1 hypothetical protein SD425_08830 [Hymenobacter sp. GOD-10R]
MISSFRTLRITASLLVLTSFVACSKKDAEPEYIGTSWTADGQETKTGGSTQVNTADIYLSINQAGVGSTITPGLYLIIPKRVGTYDLAVSSNGAQASYTSENHLFTSTSGTITVTTLTATALKGTFTFTGTDKFSTPSTTKTITNGKFNLQL